MATNVRRRDDRVEVRVSRSAKQLLQRAAAAQRKTVSAFMLDSGITAAAEALADRREFEISAKDYDAFVAALDASAKAKPRLSRLLNTPSVLEE
jgi:uncharacterized protein (DUF1778 family)